MPSLIYIRSKYRIANSASTTDFKVRIDTNRHIKKLKFKQISIFQSWYPIDSTNNSALVNLGAGNITFTVLTPTAWTGPGLATALQTALNTASAGFTVTYNSATLKYTISNASSFSMLWATSATTLYKIYGFNNADTVSSTSQTSPNIGQSLFPTDVDIRSLALTSAADPNSYAFNSSTTKGSSSDIYIDNSQPIFITIPCQQNLGDMLVIDERDVSREIVYSKGKTMQMIDIQVLNPWTGAVINNNGLDWTMVVEAEFD